MILFEIISIILITFDGVETVSGNAFRWQSIDIVTGYRSTKTILSQHDGLSRIDCMSFCMITENCAGMNFHPGAQSQCQLLADGCGQEVADDWEFAPRHPGVNKELNYYIID